MMNPIKKFIYLWKHFEEYENSVIIGEPIDLDYIEPKEGKKEVEDGRHIRNKYSNN